MKISMSEVPTDLILKYVELIQLISKLRYKNLELYRRMDAERSKTHDLIRGYRVSDDKHFDFDLANLCEAALS